MSYVGRFFPGSGADPIETLTGNSGGPVPPTGFNINILGTGVITVIGNPATSTLTITPSGAIASSFPTDSGTATPSGGVLNVFGGTAGRDINTSGSGNTIHIDLDNAITLGDLSNITGSPALTLTTGDATITAGNINLPFTNAAGTVGAIYINGNLALNSLGIGNFFMGIGASNLTFNTGLASANVGYGLSVLSALTTGSANTSIGYNNLTSLQSGSSSTALGASALSFLVSGSSNIAIGSAAGRNFTGAESDNIDIGNLGVLGESGVIRIGTNGTQTSTFVAGINGVTSSNALMVTIDSVTDQLGVLAIPGGGGITTINGDTGSVTGATVSIIGNGATAAGSSISFSGSGTTLTLNTTDASQNTIIGLSAGNGTITGNDNTGFGYLTFNKLTSGVSNTFIGHAAGGNILSGSDNTGIGRLALQQLTTGSENMGIGTNSLGLTTTGNRNTAIGYQSLVLLTDVGGGNDNNTAIGWQSLWQLATGINNTAIGQNAGSNYTSSESSNISIGSNVNGTAAESNTLRIGAGTGTGAGQLNKAFISGINGTTSTGTTVVVSSGDQLTAGGIATNTSQPAFLAVKSATSSNVTGNGTQVTIVADTEIYDQNSDYNNGTGVFTAPVTGKYFLAGRATIIGCTIANSLQLAAVTSNNNFAYNANRPASSNNYDWACSVSGDMDAGDTVSFKILTQGEAADTDDLYGDGTTQGSYVNGWLLG